MFRKSLVAVVAAAIVGHLGTPELAGLGVAAVVLQTLTRLRRTASPRRGNP